MHAAYGERLGPLYKTSNGRINPNPESITAEACARVRPGGGVRGPAREIARFYQMLLNHGSLDGVRILLPQTVDTLSARHRAATMDLTFKRIIDWGLGVLVNSSQYGEDIMPYGFGKHASRRTYGHSGAESSSAFVDPDHRLAGAIFFNGTPGDAPHQQRIHDVLTALYEDLGLV
jgi:CubicO group peptidase (beta-lactamase class C family)